MNTQTLRTFAPVVLRYSMAMVVIWFGMQQLIHTDAWTAYVPPSAATMTHLNLSTIVILNGMFEVLFGALLAVGWQIRFVALLLGLHMLDIMYVVGYGEIGVRDFGLALAVLSVALQGNDILSS